MATSPEYRKQWRIETYRKRREAKLCFRCSSSNLYLEKDICQNCYIKKTVWSKNSRKRLKEIYIIKKLCSYCGKSPPKSENHRFCSKCLERRSQRAKKARPEKYKNTWEQLFEHYGYGCACCGEMNKAFLCIDHINNDGGEQRRRDKVESGGLAFHIRVIKQNFPSDLQILCFNCNMGKFRVGGVCPHSEEGKKFVIEKFGE